MTEIDKPAPANYAPYRLVFQNPGLVDMLAVQTFGVNAKDYANPIGYFGTGLKYAIAIILREKGRFTIFRGIERFEFTARTVEIRGKEFNIVHCNAQPLSFTTDIGKNWLPWMALRELYCNTLDEKGEVMAMEQEPMPEASITKMVVTGEQWGKVWAEERGSFILSSIPLAASNYVDVHPGESHYLYYKGIRAYRAEKPFMFTYNVKGECILTEDRSIAWEWQAKDYIYRGILGLKNKEVLRKLFGQISREEETHYAEFDFTYPEGYEMSAEAKAVIKELHAAKNLAGRGLGHYRERSFIEDVESEDVVLTAEETTTVEKVNDLLSSTGIAFPFYQMVVTEVLESRFHITNKPMGIGLVLRDGSPVFKVRHERSTLLVPRRTIMQGVIATLEVILEAWLEKDYSKDKLVKKYVEVFLTLKTLVPNWTAASQEETEVPPELEF